MEATPEKIRSSHLREFELGTPGAVSHYDRAIDLAGSTFLRLFGTLRRCRR